MMNGKMKRLLAGLMCLVMVVGLLPVTAGAAELANGYYYIGDGEHFVAADGSASTEPYACYVKAIDGGYSIACDSGYLAAITADTTEIAYVDTSDTAFAWQWDGEHFYMTPDTYEASASYICYSSDVTGGLGLTTDRSAAFTAAAADSGSAADTASSNDFYRIVHLDCGRKYFSVDSIKTLIDNAAAAGFNQIQLAFGNDGLRFLLNDMSFTANGTDYTHDAVVSAVESGNSSQNSSGDKRWLNETEMAGIISYANDKELEVVPLLNLPGHANAILDIANDAYNYSGSNNTLDVTNEKGVAFATAIFQKYVDWFAGKGCKYFNFGADEYGNDINDGDGFSFGRMSDSEYTSFVTFINSLSAYIKSKEMTPRAFNDGLYFRGLTSSVNIDTDIQCCYWSNGWGDYPVASASTIASKGHEMINTHGDYYYVLKNNSSGNQIVPGNASGFDSTVFMGSTISDPVGAMFCIWCDYPNYNNMTDEDVITAASTYLSAMGTAMKNTQPAASEEGGDNTGGESGGNTGDEGGNGGDSADAKNITLYLGDDTRNTATETIEGVYVADTTYTTDDEIVKVTIDGTEATEGGGGGGSVDVVTVLTEGATYIIGDGTNWMKVDGTSIIATGNSSEAEQWKVVLQTGAYYLQSTTNSDMYFGIGSNQTSAALTNGSSRVPVAVTTEGYLYNDRVIGNDLYFEYDGEWLLLTSVFSSCAKVYSASSTGGGSTTTTPASTKVTFEALKEGTTTVEVGGVTYNVTVIDPYMDITVNYVVVGEDGAETTVKTETIKVLEDATTATLPTIISATVNGETKNYIPTSTTLTLESGKTEYTVIVTETTFDPSTVSPIIIEYWLTNSPTWPNNSDFAVDISQIDGTITKVSRKIYVNESTVYSADGALISDFVFTEGISTSTPNDENGNPKYDSVIWQARVLPYVADDNVGNGHQILAEGCDKTSYGKQISKIRYWDGAWQYYDGTTWHEFASDNADTDAINEADQLVAYYLLKSDLAEETIVYSKDWGFHSGDNWGYYVSQDNPGFLSVEVVYPNGTTRPEDLAETTWIFGYSGIRDAGLYGIEPTLNLNGASYEVYRVTVTPGNITEYTATGYGFTLGDGFSSADYTGTETIIYNADLGKNLGEYIMLDSTDDDMPIDMQFNSSTNAYRIRIYVRQIATSDDYVTVKYVDNTSGTEFYSYDIVVREGESFSGKTITNESGVLNGAVVESNIYEDGKYLEATVSSDLSTMPEISEQYRYCDPTFESFDVSTDGKVLTLYYTFNPQRIYVLDFGLPVTIEHSEYLTDTIDEMIKGDTEVSVVSTEWHYSGTTHYGTLNTDTDGTVTYMPTSTLDGVDSFTVIVNYSSPIEDDGTASIAYHFYFVPASNMLYEEGFMTVQSGNGADWLGGSNSINNVDSDKNVDTDTDGKQSNANAAPYGYDEEYNGSTGASGTQYVATLASSGASKFADYMTFTFTGTGFDLIGACGPETGTLMVRVDKNGSYFKSYLVDTSFSDDLDGDDSYDKLYQVPIVHAEDWELAEYTVTVSGAYISYKYAAAAPASFGLYDDLDMGFAPTVYENPIEIIYELFYSMGLNERQIDDVEFINMDALYGVSTMAYDADPNTAGNQAPASMTLEIDGFRVYRTTQNASYKDADPGYEYGAEYFNVLEKVSSGIVAYIESTGTLEDKQYTATDYQAAGGPQNEIYLEAGSSIAFAVNDGYQVQVSLRSVAGDKVVANGTKDNQGNVTGGITIEHSTEMYYIVTPSDGKVTISNTSGTLLGVGNIKIVPTASVASEASIMMLSADDYPAVFSLLRSGGSDIVDPNAAPEETPEEDESGDATEVPEIIYPIYTPGQSGVFRPEDFDIEVGSYTLFGQRFVTIKVNASTDVDKLTINGTPLWAANYIWVKQGLADEYVYTMLLIVPENEAAFFEVLAYNADGLASKVYTITD